MIIIIMASLLAGCSAKKQAEVAPAKVENKEETKINNYTINADLNPADKTLTVDQQVVYKNNDNVELNELYFHVYANAFKAKETAPFLFDDFERAYSRGFSPGYTDVTAVELSDSTGSKPLKFSFQGEGQTIMKVELPQALKPNESVSLAMKYKIVIPPAGERFGYGKSNFNLGNWYPVAAVYDSTGWNLDKYYAVGDPFYSDVSDYTVNISAPKEYTIAASGVLKEEKEAGGEKTWRFEADDMRDFAFIANTAFQVIEDNVGDTEIKSYYYKGQDKKGKAALQYAKESIEVFNRRFGKYPYPNYSVVETEFPSGMEYPGLVYINEEYYDDDSNEDYILFTTVHETAHQWWYGVVGNDEIDEAWLDEGFATYSEVVFVEDEFGRKSGDSYYKYIEGEAKDAISNRAFDGVVLKPLSKYKNWKDYGPAVYNEGAVLLNEVRKQVGDEKFYDIMKTYYKEYAFKNATTGDFLKVCEQVGGKDFSSVFDKYLSAKQ